MQVPRACSLVPSKMATSDSEGAKAVHLASPAAYQRLARRSTGLRGGPRRPAQAAVGGRLRGLGGGLPAAGRRGGWNACYKHIMRRMHNLDGA